MSIKVLRPGLLTSVQDLGRYGHQRHGVVVGGAMDPLAIRTANIIVGNDESCAALEMTMKGPVLEFINDAVIAIAGAEMSPQLDHREIDLLKPLFAKKGSVLRFGRCKAGCRAYLAVAGGIDVPFVMDSRSTYLRAGIGGFEGRALKSGDIIRNGKLSEDSIKLFGLLSSGPVDWSISRELYPIYSRSSTARVILGSEFRFFTAKSRQAFFNEQFEVSPKSDRMGYRLEGLSLELEQPIELLSEAVTIGTIQVPPGGSPIVLMADRQTTGGYPKIGYVASIDLPILAQLKPGDSIQFEEISLLEAQRLYLTREQHLKRAKQGLKLMLRR